MTPEAGRILCLEKGYYGVKSIRRNNAAYTTGEYPILQVSYECGGSEDRLCECSITTNNTCNNNEIAAVECYMPGQYKCDHSVLHYVYKSIMQNFGRLERYTYLQYLYL